MVRDAFGVSSSRKSSIFERRRACGVLAAGASWVFVAVSISDL
ncbi:hypothetical protein BN903_10 [Halorubrum sp. AJ67]|nr:hypothetical protein BN903_10 [Halorubrum sp. AJ67]